MPLLMRLLLSVSVLWSFLGTTVAQYNPPNAIPPIPSPRLRSPATNSNTVSPAPFNQTNSTNSAPTNISTNTASSTPAVDTSSVSKNVVLPVSMDKIDDKRALVMGDVINYRVLEDQDPPRSIQVNESGEIEVPLLGRIPASGKTLRKLANEIKALLEKDYYYQSTVLLSMDMMARSAHRLGKIYVVGQIRAPGAQDIPEDETYTVSKAILRAGGFGDFADKRKVKLVRKKAPDSKETETTLVDCTLVFDKGDTTNDPVVKADDLIIVPQRLINF